MLDYVMGDVAPETRLSNRQALEANLLAYRVAMISQGELQLDRPPSIPPGSRILGAGMRNTKISGFQGMIEGSEDSPDWYAKAGASNYPVYAPGGKPLRDVELRGKFGPISPAVSIESVTLDGLWLNSFPGLLLRDVAADRIRVTFSSSCVIDRCEAERIELYHVGDSSLSCLRGWNLSVTYSEDVTLTDIRLLKSLKLSGERFLGTGIRLESDDWTVEGAGHSFSSCRTRSRII